MILFNSTAKLRRSTAGRVGKNAENATLIFSVAFEILAFLSKCYNFTFFDVEMRRDTVDVHKKMSNHIKYK